MNTQTLTASHDLAEIAFGMGCFWGAERRFRQALKIDTIEVGYSNGDAAITDYQTVLATEKALKSGLTNQKNHAEVVKVCYDPKRCKLTDILVHFWESHDPTQGDRQGNDIGSNYRSGIYYTDPQQATIAQQSLQNYQQALSTAGYGPITTEILPLQHYNRAEESHQRYLEKHPNGYCGLGGLKIPYPQSLI